MVSPVANRAPSPFPPSLRRTHSYKQQRLHTKVLIRGGRTVQGASAMAQLSTAQRLLILTAVRVGG